MNVKRLRPLPTPDELAAMYATPHDHRLYGRGHDERVEATIQLALDMIPEAERLIVADLSCGNGEIARRIATERTILGDLAPGYAFHGPIERTVEEIPLVDVFVCSETLEHLDDPVVVLQQIRAKAERLVLSTPLDCWEDANGEHLWAWSQSGVEELATMAGWDPFFFVDVDSRTYGEPYRYGIWVFR